MKIVGFVVEYNPFHNGHLWHLRQAKELSGCSYAIGVMSGNFVQRGEPAVCDKWKRAEMAVRSGVDLIIELPVAFVLRSAQYFAGGAVRLLHSLGIVTHMGFGAECPDLPLLEQVAAIMDSPLAQQELQAALKRGDTYAKAMGKALQLAPDISREAIASPNNILAFEYLRAIGKFAPELIPIVISRRQSNYHDTEVDSPFASATALRKALLENDLSGFKMAAPAATYEIVRQILEDSLGPVRLESFSDIILAKLRMSHLTELSHLPGVSEGLDYKLRQCSLLATNMEELLAMLKSKRYTHVRLQRLLLCVLLGISENMLQAFEEAGPLYARVLGFNDNGRRLLKHMAKQAKLPLITKTTRYLNSSARTAGELTLLQQMLALDTLATDLYALGVPGRNGKSGGADFNRSPVYIPQD
jgi:predicted nucleotidyltransferase